MATGTSIGALLVQLILDDKEFDLEKPKKDVKAFGDQLDSFADSISETFTGAMKAAGAAVVGMVGASAVMGAQFESQMTKVGVIAGATGEDFDVLTNKARELGATTAFSATQAADAMEILASAGLGVNEILSATGDVLVLAGAGGTDLQTSAAILASTMSQFGLEAKEAGRISDVFAKVTASTQFQVDDLAEAMKYGGIVGAGFGWSLEQTTAALGMFRDMGMKGSMAGSALRSVMVGAASTFDKNVQVLEKYGLTLAEISPDTKSFGEIMLAVGQAGMSTSDAMVVFGTEAGAAFNSMAKEVAAGSTKYQDLTASLEEAAGTSATMYGEMQDNVMGSFKELQSGLEEGLLALFDSFSGPLGRLLDAVTKKLGGVIQYFKDNSSEITSALESQVDAVIGWLDENGNLLAASFTEGAKAVVGLAGTLGSLLPLLDEVALAVTAIFIAKKILDFANALRTAIAGLRALQAAIAATNVEMIASSGGLWAIVLAIGAAVAAIYTLVSAYSDAQKAAEKLRLEQERGVKVSQEMSDLILSRYGKEITASKSAADAKKLELAASGALTSARREELDVLRKSTEAEIASMVSQGKLVEYQGELRTVASLYESLNEDAMAPVQARIREMAKDQKDLADRANGLEKAIAAWEARSGGQAELWASSVEGFKGGVEEARAQVGALREQALEVGKGIRTLKGENTDAQASFLEGLQKGQEGMKATGKAAEQLSKEEEKAAEKAAKAWEEAFARATDATISAAKTQKEALEDVNADERESLRLKQARELADLQDSEDKALAEVTDNLVAQMILEQQFSKARQDMEQRHAVETRRFEWEQTKKELEEKLSALKDRTEAHQKALDALISLERQNMTDLEQFDAQVNDFFRENAGLTADEKIRAEQAFAVQRAALLEKEKKAEVDAAAAEKKARQEALLEILQTTEKVFAGIARVVGGVVDGVRTASQKIGEFLGKLVDLAKKVVGAISEVFSTLTGGEVSLNAISYISEALDAIASGEASGASVGDVAAQFVEEMAANAQTFLDGVVEALPSVIQALLNAVPTLVQAFASALPTIAEELAAMIPGLVSALAEAMPEVVQGIAQALPIIVEAISGVIPDLVEIVAENIPVLIQAVITSLPTLIMAVAEAIPDLVAVLAENLPSLIEAIVALLPEVIDALIDSIPPIMDAVGEALPILIDGIIAEIPRIIDAVAASVPQIAAIISDAIVQVIEALPEIIDSILESLPEIITGILQAIPQIISALVDAIPLIIEQVIANLPAIVQALVEGILAIIVRIAEELPFLVAAIIELIPELVDAILGMLPDIITAIIEAIPDIIFGLIRGLPDIITALVMLIPDLIVAIITNLPQIISALVVGLVTEIIANLPQMIGQLVTGLVNGLVEAFRQLVEMLKEWLSGVFGSGSGTDGKDESWVEDTAENVWGWVKDAVGAYSGISYVPATMRGVTLHKGEAVLTADENSRRLFGGGTGPSQATPGAPLVTPQQGGEPSSLETLFAVDGRVVDGCLLRASANGKGQVTKMMKRRAGVKSGVKTSGRFKLWSR